MGNHEYCEYCGENDFHHGRPCNPELLAAMDAQKKRQKEYEELCRKNAIIIQARLESQGYQVSRDNYGNLVLLLWQFGNL